jgi:hypothetical protein
MGRSIWEHTLVFYGYSRQPLPDDTRRQGTAWCVGQLVGAGKLVGIAGRPPLTPDASLAVQAKPRSPPPHPAAAAQGHELASIPDRFTTTRQSDDVTRRRDGLGLGSTGYYATGCTCADAARPSPSEHRREKPYGLAKSPWSQTLANLRAAAHLPWPDVSTQWPGRIAPSAFVAPRPEGEKLVAVIVDETERLFCTLEQETAPSGAP